MLSWLLSFIKILNSAENKVERFVVMDSWCVKLIINRVPCPFILVSYLWAILIINRVPCPLILVSYLWAILIINRVPCPLILVSYWWAILIINRFPCPLILVSYFNEHFYMQKMLHVHGNYFLNWFYVPNLVTFITETISRRKFKDPFASENTM
jgi:hypothetical protein